MRKSGPSYDLPIAVGVLLASGQVQADVSAVLFLGELPEFGHQVLEVMRQPLEDGVVSLGRARGTISFPAKFMLVGAMNPCRVFANTKVSTQPARELVIIAPLPDDKGRRGDDRPKVHRFRTVQMELGRRLCAFPTRHRRGPRPRRGPLATAT